MDKGIYLFFFSREFFPHKQFFLILGIVSLNFFSFGLVFWLFESDGSLVLEIFLNIQECLVVSFCCTVYLLIK